MTIAKSVIAATGFFVAALITPLTAFSQDRCPPRSYVLSYLAIEYAETPLLIGDDEGDLVEVFSSPNGETFTIVVTQRTPQGLMACIVAEGKDLRHVPFAPGAPS